jgi:hypothetical protein
VELAEEDTTNTTTFVATVLYHDTKSASVTKQALPRVLRDMVTEPAEIFMPSGEDTCVAEWKLLRQYIAPLFGVRYVSEYQSDDLRPENMRAYDVDPMAANKMPAWRGAGLEGATGPNTGLQQKAPETEYQIRTKIHTMRSRYPGDKVDNAGGTYDEDSEDELRGDPMQDELGVDRREDTEMNCHCPTPATCVCVEDMNRPVPDVIVRECRRMTLAVVNFLRDVHGLDTTHIKCEFVENYDKKLVLQSLYEVVFRNEAVYQSLLESSILADVPDGMDQEPAFADALYGADSPTASAKHDNALKPRTGARTGARANVSQSQTLESQYGGDVRRFKGQRPGEVVMDTRPAVNWRRTAKQASKEILALNNELLQKQKTWASERRNLVSRIAGMEQQQNGGRLNITQLKEKNDALERLVDDLRLEGDQNDQNTKVGKDELKALRVEMAQRQNTISRMQKDQVQGMEQQQSGDAQSNYTDKSSQIRDLRNAHRQSGHELQESDRAKGQMLDRLQTEQVKNEEMAQLMDLMRDFTPKYFETVSTLLQEARGNFDGGMGIASLDEYVFDQGWGRLKMQIADNYRRSIRDMKNKPAWGGGPGDRRSAHGINMAKTQNMRPQSGKAQRRGNGSVVMRHFQPPMRGDFGNGYMDGPELAAFVTPTGANRAMQQMNGQQRNGF